jgi:beta-glucosidase
MHGSLAAGRLERLVAEMDLTEKLGQMSMLAASLVVTGPPGPDNPVTLVRQGKVGGILNTWGYDEIREAQRVALEETRLRIPLYFAVDILHGHRTIHPIPLAEACAFDRALWRRTAQESAEEATRDGIQMTFAPMLDVCRDPRWGRIAECAGEDGYVHAEYAREKVLGFQSANPDPNRRLMGVAKHFVAYGAVKAGRDYAEVDISRRALHEIYLPPFKAAVDAGVAGVMPSFTDIAGVAMTAHRELLHDLLRVKWGFKGVIISDYNAIAELMNHGVAADLAEAAALALYAGVDIDMMAGAYENGLPVALERGLVSMAQIDTAVLRILRMKQDMGLFENPLRGLEQVGPTPDNMPGHRASGRDAARRSIVLAKNLAALPLPKNSIRIAAIGPLADAQSEMMGPWCMAGDEREAVGILQGLRESFPDADVLHAIGAAVDEDPTPEMIAQAVETARASDFVLLCLGELRQHCGEAASRTLPRPSRGQRDLARAILAVGKPVVLVLVTSRPWILPDWLVDGVRAVMLAMFGGTEAGRAIADVIAGDYNPSGRLCISWPTRVGQIPVHYSMRKTGRPFDPNNGFSTRFMDSSIWPRWGFGDGLSYSAFTLGDARTDKPVIEADAIVRVSIDVTNAAGPAGEATLFLFIHDPVALVTRPALELKDFAKVFLAQEETATVSFNLTASQLAYPGFDMEPRLDDGRIDILVGTSARTEDLRKISIEVRTTPVSATATAALETAG